MNRLKGVKNISLLFEKGRVVNSFPISLIYVPSDVTAWLVSVGKKTAPLAVDRNKIKRMLRLGVRENLLLGMGTNKKNFFFGVVYIGKLPACKKSIDSAFLLLLKKMKKRVMI